LASATSNRSIDAVGECSAGYYAVGRTVFSFFWYHPIKLLEWQEAIVQLAEVIHCQHNVEGGGDSSCAIEYISGESVPITSRF